MNISVISSLKQADLFYIESMGADEGQMNPPHFYLVKEMPLFSKVFDADIHGSSCQSII